MSALTCYFENLADPVAPGDGCHPWLLKVADLGKLADVPQERCFSDIRAAIPPGKRHVPDREIQDALHKAYDSAFTPTARPKPVVNDGNAARQKIIATGRFSTETELISASPIPIPDEPVDQQRLFLVTMYSPSDFVFCGDRESPGTTATIQPACHWTEHGAPGPFVIVNPLSGYASPKKSGDGETYRGDGCIKTYMYALIEFDGIPIESQIRFWSGVKLPVKAIVFSGGKSLHGWLDIADLKINSLKEWEQKIKTELYGQLLKPLGVDIACSNPARLSRLPGVFRQEKNQWQRLLWLSDEGTNVGIS